MREGPVVRETDVYYALKNRLDALDADRLIGFLDEMRAFAGYYSKLLRPEREASIVIRSRLEAVNRLEATVAYPFLLNVFDDYAQRKLSEAEFAEVIEAVETFLVRRYICGAIRAELNKLFPRLHRRARLQRNLVVGTKLILARNSFPSDDHFCEQLLRFELYGQAGRRERGKFILERLEEALGHAEGVRHADLSIEHVMPQTLTEWWRAHLGDGAQETHTSWLHTLGNLTLTGYNPELSNDSFDKKKGLYANSHIELTRALAQFERWGALEIEERGRQLAKLACRVWPDLAASTGARNHVDAPIRGSRPTALTVFGEMQTVDSWQEVWRRTLDVGLQLGQLEEVRSSLPRLVSTRAADLRAPRELSGGKYYYESNISAERIFEACQEVALCAGLSPEDYRITYGTQVPTGV
jgi:hypothetical protein